MFLYLRENPYAGDIRSRPWVLSGRVLPPASSRLRGWVARLRQVTVASFGYGRVFAEKFVRVSVVLVLVRELVQVGVDAVGSKEFLVAAYLRDGSLVKHHDTVRFADG